MKWRIADWIVRGLLALGFSIAAMGKLVSHPGVLRMFEDYGYPAWFHWFVGALEIGGAILILTPKWRYVGLALLGVVVFGATVTHLRFDPLSELWRPAVFGTLLAAAALLPRHFRQVKAHE